MAEDTKALIVVRGNFTRTPTLSEALVLLEDLAQREDTDVLLAAGERPVYIEALSVVRERHCQGCDGHDG